MPCAKMTDKLSAALLRRCRQDPVFFCSRVLGVRPWQKQAEVLRALRDSSRVAVRSGHGTGKSFIAASAALWFLYSFYPSKVVTTAPTWNQVRGILWNEIRRQHANASVRLGGSVLEERIKLAPDAFAVGLSTDAPERFQGYHAEHLLVILDEAPGVRPEIWEAAETLLTSRNAKMLAIGNPVRPSGNFYRCFAPGSNWETICISCLDSPNLDGQSRAYPALVTRSWIAEKAREWGEKSPFYQARVLGEFPDEGDGALLPRSSVAAAAARKVPPLDAESLRLGVDVARTGSDHTVFVLRDRYAVRHVETHHGWSTMETTGRVVRLVRDWNLPPQRVFVDDTGLGAGVTDRLRELDLPVRAVVLGSAPRDREHFANARAESFWRLRECLLAEEETFSLGNDADLARELGSIRYRLTSTGAILIEPKDELRARLGNSPDRADALALTFAETVYEPEITLV